MSLETGIAAAARTQQGRPDRYKWIALSNTTIGTLMATIDSSIVLISIPAIFRGIGINPLTASNTRYLLWLLMAYLVVTAVLVVSFGRIGDMFGRVKMYNLGFAIFTAGSLAASLTYFGGPAAALYLIGMRIVQGVGGAMILANSTAILTDAFPEYERGMALGINSVAFIAGTFIGLVAGGLLASVDWHLIFYVSVPIGLFGTVWAQVKLREVQTGEGGRLDLPGNILFGAGLVAVLVGITYSLQPYGGSAMGWLNPLVLGLLIGGVAMLTAFVVVETKVSQPMFDMRLFRSRGFTAGNIASLLASISRGGLMFILIIWLQGIWLPRRGYSFVNTPLWAGIYMVPLTAGFLIAGPVSGFLSDRFGARPFATGGMIIAAASFALLTLLPVNFSYVWFALLLLANGLGMGMFVSPNTAAIMNAAPANRRGVASGMRSTFQNAGMTLSIGLFFTIMIIGLSASLPVALSHGLSAEGLSPGAAARIAHLPPASVLFAAFLGYNPMSALLGPALRTLSPARRTVLTGHSFFADLISGPFHHGLTIVFTFAVVMCLIAAAASWLRGGKAAADTGAALEKPGIAPHRQARVVTISASFGAGGTEVGPAVARRLGLPFLDRAVPFRVADLLGVSPRDVLAHDQQVQGAMIRSLADLIGTPAAFGPCGAASRPADCDEVFRQATEQVLWELAAGPGGVVLDRAAAVVLASFPGALHVRLDGQAAARASRAAAREGIGQEAAWQRLNQADRARAAYTRQLYGTDPANHRLYHLVIDTTAVPLESCADAIAALATMRPRLRCVTGVGEDADHWRAEGEGLGARPREAGAPQQVLDLAGGAAGRARRGAGAAGLGRDGNPPAGCEPPAQLGEPLRGRGPEPVGVDGEDGVEGAVESGRKLIDRRIDQGDPAGPDRGGVAPGRLPEHHAGMVDAVHVTRAGADQFGDGQAGAEADLKDTVGGLHTEQRDNPAVALPVGRAVGKHPASHAPGRAMGMMALADGVAVQGAHGGYPGPPDHILSGGGRHPPWHASVMFHGRQSTPSSAPEVNPPGLLTIGELARRAGVTTSAVRYYEELGLLPAPARISGQRRYPESAARLVAAILLYSDAGFTLAEQKALMATRASTPGDRKQLMQRKLAELDEQIARAQAVREAIRHGLRCPHEDITQCPNFNAGITARLAGQPLSRSHQELHGQRSHESPGAVRRPPRCPAET